MPRITRPDDTLQQGTAQISLGAAGQAGAGSVAMGEVVQQVGHQAQQNNIGAVTQKLANEIDAAGDKMFNDSKKAHQSAVLLNKMTQATEMYLGGRDQRYTQGVDADGNPTFTNLSSDCGSMGDSIGEDVAGGIIDPEVANQFRQEWGHYMLGQKVAAFKEARKQQLAFSMDSLDKGLGKLVTQSLSDNVENAKDYELRGLNAIRDAVTGGVIDQQDGENLGRQFSVSIREANIQNLMKTNKGQAQQVLSMPADKLGIPEDRKAALTEQLQASIRSDQADATRAGERQKVDSVNQENSLVESVEARIDAGAIREDELLQLRDQFNPTRFSDLKKQYLKSAQKREQVLIENQNVGNKIANGESLSDLSPNNINNYHQYLVEQLSDQTKKPVSLQDKAKLAATIPTAVSDYGKELSYATKYGDTKNASDAIAAYSYLKDRNKPTLDGAGFDKESTLIMEHAQLLVERGGVSPQEAMKQSREKVLNPNPALNDYRADLFKKEKDFQVNNIEETAATALGAETTFFHRNFIDQESVATYRQLVQEAYLSLGDKSSAVAYATTQMNKTHGISEVGGRKVYMLNPPEKAYPQISSDRLRASLQGDVATVLPQGESVDNVSIAANPGNPKTWIVTHKVDMDGKQVEMPLVNPKNGQVVTWAPATTGTAKPPVVAPKPFEDLEQKAAGVSPMSKNIQRIAPNATPEIKAAFNDSEATLSKYGIDTPARQKMFLAQTAHESANFTALTEKISNSRAESNYGYQSSVGQRLGNVAPGDGARYKGRGIIQLTGRSNYQKIGDRIGVDLVNNPSLAADPKMAIEIAAAFWQQSGLNQLADSGDVRAVTKVLNGGLNGLSSRMQLFNKLH